MLGLGVITAAAYWPGWLSPAVSPRFAALSIIAPALLLWRQEAIRFTRAHLAGCALVLWAAASVLWSPVQYDSIDTLWQTVLVPAVCFCLGSQSRSLRPLFFGLAIGLAASSVLVVLEWTWPWWHGGPFPIDEVWRPAGLFVNKNSLAEAAALVAVWLIAERCWWPLVLIAPSLMFTGARGALLGIMVSVVAPFWREWKLFIPMVIGVVYIIGSISMSREASLNERFDIWSYAAAGVGWFGHGLGSFWALPQHVYADGTPDHVHNDFLELASDLGVVGVVLLGWFVFELRGALDSARLVLIALAVEAFFAFPLHLPVPILIGSICAGHAVRNRPVLRREPLLGRGPLQESFQ